MIRRLTLELPAGVSGPAGRPSVRLLAVADERDAALDHELNRSRLGRIDGILGCGDLEPDYLAFLADAFRAPLLLVRGNHDRGGAWETGRNRIAQPLDARIDNVGGVAVLGLSWPGRPRGRAVRSEMAAWRQALAAWLRARVHGVRPLLVISHVPPLGTGDPVDDPYHTGFRAYTWLLRRLGPPLWLHGHTHPASISSWRTQMDGTRLANVTGAVLVELTGGVRTSSSMGGVSAGATIEGE